VHFYHCILVIKSLIMLYQFGFDLTKALVRRVIDLLFYNENLVDQVKHGQDRRTYDYDLLYSRIHRLTHSLRAQARVHSNILTGLSSRTNQVLQRSIDYTPGY
jgi:hypothetical protein